MNNRRLLSSLAVDLVGTITRDLLAVLRSYVPTTCIPACRYLAFTCASITLCQSPQLLEALQVSDKERKVHYDALFKDVANVLVDK